MEINFSEKFNAVKNEISNHIIGQKETIHFLITAIIAGGNILLEGMPGLGKTRLIKAASQALDISFSRIQFTPDLTPSDITGTDIMTEMQGEKAFHFRKGPVFANIVLADEINRATPKTQSALLEAMQEKTVTAGNNTYSLPNPFFVLATQNPIELEGTYPLPEAQLDRFMFKLCSVYPTKEELSEIARMTTSVENTPAKQVCSGEEILKLKDAAQNVPIAESVMNYAIDIVYSTHPENGPEFIKKYISCGSSPRGAQALINAAKINALSEDRYNVSYDDIEKCAFPALRHRLLKTFEAESDSITADNAIEQIIASLKKQ